MSKGAYIGVNNVAHKIKKGYIGVNGVARRIKKAYIGIGGVARPCWSGGELVYYGQLSEYICATVGASTSEYAIFSGSKITTDIRTPDGDYAYNYAFDKKLTLNRISGDAYNEVAAASVGDHVLFAGGLGATSETSADAITSRVYAINNSLTIINISSLKDAKCRMTGTTLGNYAIFGGGSWNTSDSGFSVAEVYDAQLVKINTNARFGASGDSASTTIGQYAISCGGSVTATTTVFVCDTSLTNIDVDFLPVGKTDLAATSVGNYAIFAGGGSWGGNGTYATSTVDVYDINLVKSTAPNLSSEKRSFSGTTIEDFAIFSNGIEYDVYDSQLIHTSGSTNIARKTSKIGAATIGDYAIFVGEKFVGEKDVRYPHIFTIA